ncbi:MFS transporter [Roseivirga sp. BDSF3-8]|uniref:MFS transporter n=1 Tax=Roseivirga sp. BDSF3-8 TaxID=3241598 RepID=UPI00353270AE
MSNSPTSGHRPVSREEEKYVLIATILASSMAFIDYSALNVALPSLQRELNVGGKELLWIVNAYALFLSSLLLAGGAMGDLLGRKKILIAGIITFVIASILCGLAPDATFLIITRGIQGVGAALMVPGSLSIISAVIQRERRGQAYGTWSMFSALTTVAGPVLGGWLAGAGLWRAIFFINVPLGILAAFILWKKIPETSDPNAKAPDIKGSLMATLGLCGLTYSFIEAPQRGWESLWIIGALATGLTGLVLFIRQELLCPHPMVPPSLFKSRTFNGANVLTFCVYGALSVVMFFLPLNLIQVQGYPEKMAGLAILPFALCIAFTSRWAGGHTDRTGPRIFLTLGPLVAGAGYVWLSFAGLTKGPEAYWTHFFGPVVLMGTGMGLTVAPLTTTVMTAADDAVAGAASGVNNAVSRTAGVLAISILGALALVQFENILMARLQPLALSDSLMMAMKGEASELAEARVPEGINEDLASKIRLEVSSAFARTFSTIMLISAGMATSGSLIAFISIQNGKKPRSGP